MNETLRRWLSRLASLLNRLTPVQRRNITIAGVAGIVCLAVISWVVSRPNYVTVMGGLDNKSLGAVQTKLQDLKIPVQIQGDSVQVPSKDADTARIQLAMAGLPQTGQNVYPSLSSSIGMSTDQFNYQVLNNLQQSLNQTIESINGVETAVVHIVMPPSSTFVWQQPSTNQAKASVFLQLGSGVQLSAAQVAGIQQLVAHAVQGLATDNVTVADQTGATLSGDSSATSTAAGVGASEIVEKRALEANLHDAIQQSLDQMLGPGNATVVVTANVTFDQSTVQSTQYTSPNGTTGLAAHQSISKSTSTNTSGAGVGGAAGISSNNPSTPTYPSTSGTGGSSTSSSSQTDTTYNNNVTQTQTVKDPLQILGYSVGVLLNSSDKSLTPSTLAQIKQFVQTAVGQAAQGKANDVSVVSAPFQTAVVFSQTTQKISWWMYAAGGVVVLVGGFVLMRRRSRTRGEVAMAQGSVVQPLTLEDLETPPTEDELMRDQVVKLAGHRPDEFVSLLRSWISGD